MTVLKLPGGAALSGFRLEKLNALLESVSPGLRVTATQHWHFCELERPPTAEEQRTLDRLLTYGPDAPPRGELRKLTLLVTPRLGTISPWSSKATDIARQCGLAGVLRRIERGTVYHLEGRALDLSPVLPALHDRMTQTVMAKLDEVDELFHHLEPRPLEEITGTKG